MNDNLFYTKIPIPYKITLIVIFVVLAVLTLGLAFIFHDFFIEHKYWLNRRILLKFLKNENLSFTREEILDGRVIEYNFENFILWYYHKQLNITVRCKYDSDMIGLFISSFIEDKKVIEIIRQLNKI